MSLGDIMDIKKKAIKIAKKKINETKVGRKVMKSAKIGSFLLGGSLIAFIMASQGKTLAEKKKMLEDEH